MDNKIFFEKIHENYKQKLNNSYETNELKKIMLGNNNLILYLIEDQNIPDHQLKELAIIDLKGNELLHRRYSLSAQFAIEWNDIKTILKEKNILIYNSDLAELIIEKTLKKCSIYEKLNLNTIDIMKLYTSLTNNDDLIELQDACNEEEISTFITDNALNNSKIVLQLLQKLFEESNK